MCSNKARAPHCQREGSFFFGRAFKELVADRLWPEPWARGGHEGGCAPVRSHQGFIFGPADARVGGQLPARGLEAAPGELLGEELGRSAGEKQRVWFFSPLTFSVCIHILKYPFLNR